ncbi:MAG: tRNA uridine-5-carboxymethylaminomethyl(34) synthesis GTPase MnmE [Caulobacteraceae bacterium]|nr:tRNA uridine-5-carboxymethylaminomethyl(34) synthesis GTPase MnmE [Caulobacteraceae bacterium]
MSDTIFAPATAPGRAAVAVVRLSGPRSADVVARLCGGLPAPRLASLRRLRRPGDGETIDQALVLWFPGPASYTGEDCAEFHVHGGQAVVEAVVETLAALGLRLAEPGEFTRLAFQNGKLDLAQAEAVADLVDAESEAQRRQALSQLDGALSDRYAAWRASLIESLALLEAGVDFPDEELPEDLAARARPGLAALIAELDAALSDAARGERVRDGFRVALMGAPNAGKSSLLNALAGRDAAIVTAQPGTTRDVIETPLVLEGYKVLLADTAGVRQAEDVIEAEGVRRARAWAESAALRLWVVDGAAGDGHWREAAGLLRAGDICVINKADLPASGDGEAARKHAAAVGATMASVSLTTGLGLDELTGRLRRTVVAALSGADFPAATRERHRGRLVEARDHLGRAVEMLDAEVELAAEDVRLAARSLGRIAGRVDAEDVLDRVFSSFCIGK